MGLCLPRLRVQQQPSLPRFLHHAPDLNSVIPLLSLLLAPVLVAPVLGVRGRGSGSALGGCGSRARAAMEPTPAFDFHRELRPMHARACLGTASNGCLCGIIRRVMSFL